MVDDIQILLYFLVVIFGAEDRPSLRIKFHGSNFERLKYRHIIHSLPLPGVAASTHLRVFGAGVARF